MWMRAYVVVSSLALVVLSTAAFRQASTPQNLGEITVERINVVDKNGTLRMVIANQDRMHPGVIDGIQLNRPRPYAGMIFFNDAGDEVGGLTVRGVDKDGKREASASFMFDQLHQDQTIGLSYGEANGKRTAAFQIWDRPEVHLGEIVRQMQAAGEMTDPIKREAAMNAATKLAEAGHERVFVGKDIERSASVALSDADGHTRLKLTVDAKGNPRIEFLDDKGQVTQRLPQKK